MTRLMTSLLVRVTATDPVTFGLVAVLLFLLATVASWWPASRAAGLDPSEALRQE